MKIFEFCTTAKISTFQQFKITKTEEKNRFVTGQKGTYNRMFDGSFC